MPSLPSALTFAATLPQLFVPHMPGVRNPGQVLSLERLYKEKRAPKALEEIAQRAVADMKPMNADNIFFGLEPRLVPRLGVVLVTANASDDLLKQAYGWYQRNLRDARKDSRVSVRGNEDDAQTEMLRMNIFKTYSPTHQTQVRRSTGLVRFFYYRIREPSCHGVDGLFLTSPTEGKFVARQDIYVRNGYAVLSPEGFLNMEVLETLNLPPYRRPDVTAQASDDPRRPTMKVDRTITDAIIPNLQVMRYLNDSALSYKLRLRHNKASDKLPILEVYVRDDLWLPAAYKQKKL